MPQCPRALRTRAKICAVAPLSGRTGHLASLGRPLPEQPLGPEDEDQDQDSEDDRLRPLRARGVPGEALVEVLDQTDQQGPQYGAGKIADTSEDRGGERKQAERETGGEPDRRRVEREDHASRSRER